MSGAATHARRARPAARRRSSAAVTSVTHWPQLSSIGLDHEARAQPLAGIGGSDATIILSGQAERVLRLWREKRGEVPPEDLSSMLPVMLGSWSEAFNRQWYERHSGHAVVDAGLVAISADHPWRRCTIDGFVAEKASVWEAKHVNAFTGADEVLARYMPQLQHNMAVMGVENAILSVIYGNHKWESYEVAADWLYQDELLDAEQRFWSCVRSGEPPAALPPPAPPRPDAIREICLEASNVWGAAAADWLAHREAAKTHAEAARMLKELVDDDVRRAWGHGVEAKRSKAGAITIKATASGERA